jgi:hypothetical protein
MTYYSPSTCNARYGEAVLDLLRCFRTRVRMRSNARWSCGGLCIMIAKEA